MSAGRPILVTGAHRSGTTWVGKMLALAPGVAYVHEPFSPKTPKGLSPAPFRRYFTVVTRANEARYRPGLERTLALRYDLGAQLRSVRSWRDVARIPRDYGRLRGARRSGRVGYRPRCRLIGNAGRRAAQRPHWDRYGPGDRDRSFRGRRFR